VHIVIDTPPDPALWRAAFRQVLRRPMRRVRILGALLAVLGVLLVLISDGDFAPIVFGLALVVIGLLYSLFLPFRALQLSLRRMPPSLQQPLRFEVTDQYVEVTSPLIFTRYAWGAFVSIQEIPGVLLLMVSKHQTLPVPLGGVHPEELARLRDFVANRQFVMQR
jgi:uncharacterized protein YjeT (DUF2065 family)